MTPSMLLTHIHGWLWWKLANTLATSAWARRPAIVLETNMCSRYSPALLVVKVAVRLNLSAGSTARIPLTCMVICP